MRGPRTGQDSIRSLDRGQSLKCVFRWLAGFAGWLVSLVAFAGWLASLDDWLRWLAGFVVDDARRSVLIANTTGELAHAKVAAEKHLGSALEDDCFTGPGVHNE